jgi:hypothetical protein
MTGKGRTPRNNLKLTPEEAESMGVEMEDGGPSELPVRVRELPMHEQVTGALTEDDVVESMLGEVTDEGREDVEEAVGDEQEDEAEESAKL